MQGKVIPILQKFPDYAPKIDLLFQSSESFRDLCTDYILCAGKLHELKESAKEKSADIQEYEDLQKSLTEEIFHFITK
jgi:hypothetical protein